MIAFMDAATKITHATKIFALNIPQVIDAAKTPTVGVIYVKTILAYKSYTKNAIHIVFVSLGAALTVHVVRMSLKIVYPIIMGRIALKILTVGLMCVLLPGISASRLMVKSAITTHNAIQHIAIN